ncbi:transporter [Roseivirga sp.]|uniref:transporter n=1 Tax=Roseivirga sp. TaxID=1964215 RepID=UPI003B8CE35D
MKKSLSLLIFLLVSLPLLSQEEAQEQGNIVTDRPTQSVSAFTVGKGVFQLETGFMFQENTLFIPSFDPLSSMIIEANLRSITYNTSLFRYGISDRIELRLGQNLGRGKIVANGEVLSSSDIHFVPTSFGAKISLVDPVGARPAISFLGQISGPLFSEFELGTDVEFRFNFQHQLTEELSLGYNLGGTVNTNGNDNNFVGLYTAVVGYSITSKLGAFAEFYGFLPSGSTQNDHQIDFGLSYLIDANFQLDIFGGTGFSEISPETIFGFGFSARIPKN